MQMMFMKRAAWGAVGAAALLLVTAAGAAPITYTWQGVASGFLNGESFTDAALTISAHADTALVEEVSETVSRVFVIDAEVSVESIGSDFLTGTIGAVSNRGNSRVGISNFDLDRAIFFVEHPSVSTYDLATSFGPITGPRFFNSGFEFPTLGGSFALLGEVGDSATFQAMAVPEPATWAFLLAGLGVLGWRVRQGSRVAGHEPARAARPI